MGIQWKRFVLFYLLVASSLFGFSVEDPLTIRLVIRDNGVGLSKDLSILKVELENLGHTVFVSNPHGRKGLSSPRRVVDVNIFSEKLHQSYFRSAKLNYFIPNPEWCDATPEVLEGCDLILCRTQQVHDIYSQHHTKLYFLNFVSEDHLLSGVKKSYHTPIHLPGKSIYKGSQGILNVWDRRDDFPLLLFIHKETTNNISYETHAQNVHILNEYIEADEYTHIQNFHGVHLCPSESEGFGHYILEAMSTGAVVITTDAPPMNEHITDKRFLVKYDHQTPVRKGYRYFPNEEHLEQIIENTLSMSSEELCEVGRQNRINFLKKKKDFQSRLRALFGIVQQ